MTTRKSGLFLFACVCMVHLVTYTNGEVTPPWITLLGCFDVESGSQTIPLPNNSVSTCLKECTTSTFVGIQTNTCICSIAFKAIADVHNAARFSYTKCKGPDKKRFMFLYTKVSSLQNTTINQDADFGYVYVNILSSSSYEFHASTDSNEKHNFICHDGSQCTFRISGIDKRERASAETECNLVSFYDLDSCLKQPNIETGQFWIGMYRDSPYFISTLSTLSTRASTSTSASTSSTTRHLTTETPTPLTVATTDTPSATSLKVETITPTTSSFRTGNMTSTGNPNRTVTIGAAGNPDTTRTAENPDRTWTIIGAAFIAISVALVIAIIAVLVAFLRKKKDNQISHTDQENIIRPDSASMPDTSQNSTMIPDSARMPDTSQNITMIPDSAPMPTRRGDHSLGDGEREQFETDERSETETRRQRKEHKKKRKRRKSHRREQTDANNLSDTALEKGEERKHRKSDLLAEAEVNDVSETALKHSPLEHLDNDSKKPKKRKKSKKRKKKHDNTIEGSDGINVS